MPRRSVLARPSPSSLALLPIPIIDIFSTRVFAGAIFLPAISRVRIYVRPRTRAQSRLETQARLEMQARLERQVRFEMLTRIECEPRCACSQNVSRETFRLARRDCVRKAAFVLPLVEAFRVFHVKHPIWNLAHASEGSLALFPANASECFT